ncbi:MAG: PDZ domain-containing protein [Candidatus Eremiobacteraeota bacterium]|nr:PDZ domain-containing protein [Candidatus Eremiobacteraeota bacterium]
MRPTALCVLEKSRWRAAFDRVHDNARPRHRDFRRAWRLGRIRSLSAYANCETFSRRCVSNVSVGFPERAGVLVRAVLKDSAAEQAGLARGDLIVSVGKTDVRSWAQLQRLFAEIKIHLLTPCLTLQSSSDVARGLSFARSTPIPIRFHTAPRASASRLQIGRASGLRSGQ